MSRLILLCYQEPVIDLILFEMLLSRIPVLKENNCHRIHGRACDPDPGILPCPVWTLDIEIFISQIVAAGVCHPAIDNSHLPVITVI